MSWNFDSRLMKWGQMALVISLVFLGQLGGVLAQQPEPGGDESQFVPEAKVAFEAGIAALQAETPDLEEAAKQLQSAIDLQAANKEKPPLVQAYLALGQVLLELDRFEEAASKLLPVTRAVPNAPQAFLGLGRAYVELEEYAAAVEALSNAQSLSQQPNASVLYWRGRAQAELQELDVAMDDYNDALAINRNDKRIFGALGKAQMQLGDYAGAIKSLDRAVELDAVDESPNAKPYAEAYADRGRTYARIGDLEKAIEDLQQATELAKNIDAAEDEREFARDLGSVLQQDENYSEAIVAFKRVIELSLDDEDEEVKNDPIPYIILAMTRIELGKSLEDEAASREAYEAAVADCDASIKLEEKIAGAYYQRGIAQRLLEKWHDAIDSLSHALELDPRLSDAYLRRGIVWFYQGEYDIAAADFDDAIRFSAVPATAANLWKGFVHAQKGEFVKAINSYSNVLRDQPRSVTAYHNRALTHISMEQYDRAIADLNTAIRIDAKDKLAYYRRGIALSRKGEDQQAIASYSNAIRLDDKFAKSFYNRSLLHRSMGETEKADEDLAQARQLDPSLK